jgi:hypothetical protein
MPRLADERVTYITTGRTDYSRDFQGVRPERYLAGTGSSPRTPRPSPGASSWIRFESVGLVHRPGHAGGVDPLLHCRDRGVERRLRGGRLQQRHHGAGARRPEEDPDFSPPRRPLLGDPLCPHHGPLGERRGGRGGPPLGRGDPGAHQHVPRARRAAALVARLAGGHREPPLPHEPLSEEDMGEAIRYVISHEVAHAVGLPHNQRELRLPGGLDPEPSTSWSGWGTRPRRSGGPGTTTRPARRQRAAGAADRAVGQVRRHVGVPAHPRGRDPEEELETLNEWIVERADLPWFRFGRGPVRDGRGVGSVPDDRGDLRRPGRRRGAGMRNLRYADREPDGLGARARATTTTSSRPTHLQFLTQWNRYAEHAAAAVGGSWTHFKRFGEEGWVYTPFEPEYQLRAMAFLDEHVLPDAALGARRSTSSGASSTPGRWSGSGPTRSSPCSGFLNHARLARMIEHEAFHGDETYRPAEMLDDAREIVWREVGRTGPPSTPTGGTSSAPTWTRRTTSSTTRRPRLEPARLRQPPGLEQQRPAAERRPPRGSVRHPPARSVSSSRSCAEEIERRSTGA